jgi:hypothetical protein
VLGTLEFIKLKTNLSHQKFFQLLPKNLQNLKDYWCWPSIHYNNNLRSSETSSRFIHRIFFDPKIFARFFISLEMNSFFMIGRWVAAFLLECELNYVPLYSFSKSLSRRFVTLNWKPFLKNSCYFIISFSRISRRSFFNKT